MSHMALRTLVTTALLDADFRNKLLYNERQHVLSRFELTDEEHQAIQTIRANSLQDFARQLDEWLGAQSGPV